MSNNIVEKNRVSEPNWFEVEEEIVKNTPSEDVLEKALSRLTSDIELSRDEEFTVKRSLERVWHISRLMYCLSKYFSDKLSFGGGFVLNYMYLVNKGEKPRFTYDLDTAWRERVSSKREILLHIPLLNKWLAENNYSLRIPVGEREYTRLWIVEYDAEKDYFPNILSMRIPVLMRYSGEPFHRFLGVKNYNIVSKLRRVFAKTLGVENPLVDYVRFEISLGMSNAPVVKVEASDLFGFRQNILVTEPEQQIAWKITGRIGKRYENPEPYLHDVLKAVLDTRLIKHLDTGKVREYVVREEKPEDIIENTRVNLEYLREHGEKYWRNHHYILLRKTTQLDELINTVEKQINTTLTT